MNPTLEQLAQYVMQELGRGVPEVTLYNDLRRSGWTVEWINAAFSAAKQHVMPSAEGQLQIPPVQASLANPPVIAPALRSKKRLRPTLPSLPRQLPRLAPLKKPTTDLRKALTVLVICLAAIVIGLSIYRLLSGMERAAEERIGRDAVRREDLAALLSDLSDYYVIHSVYPTIGQMNDRAFLQQNGFQKESLSDPLWTSEAKECTKDGQPRLIAKPTNSCYAYAASSDKNTACDNAGTPCARTSVSIVLEKGDEVYTVLFDKNREVDAE